MAVELDAVVRYERVHPRRQRVRIVPPRVRPADVVAEDGDDVRTVRAGLVVRGRVGAGAGREPRARREREREGHRPDVTGARLFQAYSISIIQIRGA